MPCESPKNHFDMDSNLEITNLLLFSRAWRKLLEFYGRGRQKLKNQFQSILYLEFNLPYQVVFSGTKAVGENIFFRDLPLDFKVYLLCYAGTKMNEELRSELISFGENTGKNLLVNMAKPDDDNYEMIQKRFNIKLFPTIIITALSEIASPPEENSTAYVRIDNKKLLSSPDLAMDCIVKIFNLFIGGNISEAMAEHQHNMRKFRITGFLKDALKSLKGFGKNWTISFGFMGARIELKGG